VSDRDGCWRCARARLCEAARRGDGQAAAAVEQAALLIGITTANLSLVLDPSLIVLGGALMTQAPSLVESVRRVASQILPTPIEIAPSALGKDATLWGSLLVATTEARQRLRPAGSGRAARPRPAEAVEEPSAGVLDL